MSKSIGSINVFGFLVGLDSTRIPFSCIVIAKAVRTQRLKSSLMMQSLPTQTDIKTSQ
jgi:hypothetical protein